MRVRPKPRGSFHFAYVLLYLGFAAAWLSKQHPGPAVIGIACVYAVLALLGGPIGRMVGLPAFRPDEAYIATLHRWQRERRDKRAR
jgi:hypothetical protein